MRSKYGKERSGKSPSIFNTWDFGFQINWNLQRQTGDLKGNHFLPSVSYHHAKWCSSLRISVPTGVGEHCSHFTGVWIVSWATQKCSDFGHTGDLKGFEIKVSFSNPKSNLLDGTILPRDTVTATVSQLKYLNICLCHSMSSIIALKMPREWDKDLYLYRCDGWL